MRKSLFVLVAAATMYCMFPTNVAAETACVSDGDITYNTSTSTSGNIHISRTHLEISLGDSVQLSAWTGSYRDEDPYWVSSRHEIVSVDSSTGQVYPCRVGTASVTAIINDRSVSCEVEVTP